MEKESTGNPIYFQDGGFLGGQRLINCPYRVSDSTGGVFVPLTFHPSHTSMPKAPVKPSTKSKTTRKAKTPSKTKTPAKPRKPRGKNPATARTNKQARRVIELVLKEMRAGMKNPSKLLSKEWAQLFGANQSMVANLQKLIQAMAVLPEPEGETKGRDPELPPMTAQEMEILIAWLGKEGKGSKEEVKE